VRFSDEALEVLGLLARELLCVLVDCAFLVRRECGAAPDEAEQPVYRLRPQSATATPVAKAAEPAAAEEQKPQYRLV